MPREFIYMVLTDRQHEEYKACLDSNYNLCTLKPLVNLRHYCPRCVYVDIYVHRHISMCLNVCVEMYDSILVCMGHP